MADIVGADIMILLDRVGQKTEHFSIHHIDGTVQEKMKWFCQMFRENSLRD